MSMSHNAKRSWAFLASAGRWPQGHRRHSRPSEPTRTDRADRL